MMSALLASFTYTPMQRWGPISPHGLGTAVGFALGAYLMARRAEPRGIPRNDVYNAVTWGALGAILGARGFYVLGHLDQFRTVGEILAVWQGGLTMFGGFIGGLALGLWYLRRRGFNMAQTLDAAAPGFVVGVIVGRIGDIVIADHLGRPTNFFLGYRIPPGAKIAPGYGPPTYVPGAVVHHTALYDLLGALVLLGFLYALQRRRPAAGTLFAAFAIWYGLQRFFLDFTRNRELIESVYFGFSGSQWSGIAFAVGGVFALYRISRRKPSVAPVVPPGVLLEPPSGPPPWERVSSETAPTPLAPWEPTAPVEPVIPPREPAPFVPPPPTPPSPTPPSPTPPSPTPPSPTPPPPSEPSPSESSEPPPSETNESPPASSPPASPPPSS